MSEERDYSCAEEILEQTLVRLDRERAENIEEIADLTGQLEFARRQLALAEAGHIAVTRLLDDHARSRAGAAQVAPSPASVGPASEAPPALINWRLVASPRADDWWQDVYAVRWPLVCEPAPEPAAMAAMRAKIVRRPEPAPVPPPKALPAPVKAPQGRAPIINADGRSLAEVQECRALDPLKALCAATGEVTVSLSALAIKSDVPNGSILFTLRRLAEAGKITIHKNERKTGAPVPNTYRVVGVIQAPAPRPDQVLVIAPHLDEPVAPNGKVLIEPKGPWLAPARKAPAKSLHPEPEPTPCAPPEPGSVGLEAFIPDEIDRPYGEPCTLMNLRHTACHFPIGDPRPEQFYCADRAVPGLSYCADHGSAMWQGQRAKRANGAARP